MANAASPPNVCKETVSGHMVRPLLKNKEFLIPPHRDYSPTQLVTIASKDQPCESIGQNSPTKCQHKAKVKVTRSKWEDAFPFSKITFLTGGFYLCVILSTEKSGQCSFPKCHPYPQRVLNCKCRRWTIDVGTSAFKEKLYLSYSLNLAQFTSCS